MVCEHLSWLERALIHAGFQETYRGQAWSHNCREWVYYPVCLDIDRLRAEHDFAPSLETHENLDPKSGTERGLVCRACHDAIMGRVAGAPRFPMTDESSGQPAKD